VDKIIETLMPNPLWLWCKIL